jgi:hypothetical protein
MKGVEWIHLIQEMNSAGDTCDHSNKLSKVLKCIRLDLLSNCYISSSRTQLHGDV